MIELLILSVILLVGLITSVYLVGYELGSGNWRTKLDDVRAEGHKAERELHDLTGNAFVAMSEYAARHHRSKH